MDELLQKVKLGIRVSEKMIADMDRNLQEAIAHENWTRASELKSYMSGMQQILIVFEQAVNTDAG